MGLFGKSRRKQAKEAREELAAHHMKLAETEMVKLGVDPSLLQRAGTRGGMRDLIAQTEAQSAQIAADGVAAYNAMLAAGAPAPAAGASVGEDPLDALARLGQLREAGTITEEQFAAEKARLLGA